MNRKNLVRSCLVVASSLSAGVASAAVDISGAADAAKLDIATAGAVIIGVVVAVAAISWIRRVIK